MYILGVIYHSHDTAACLIKDGKLLGFIEEERLSRKKHTTELPFRAIDCLLDQEGITIDQVAYISIGNKGDYKTVKNSIPYAFYFKLTDIPFILGQIIFGSLLIHRDKKRLKKRYNYRGKFIPVDHHLAHLSSAFLVSPFERAALLSIDASGECLSSRFAVGEGNKIRLIKSIGRPASLGMLYLMTTGYLGFSHTGDEGKVMGLSSYGDPEKYWDIFKDIIILKPNGSYQFNKKYFVYRRAGLFRGKLCFSPYFYEKLGPARRPGDPLDKRHQDIAAALQKVTEETIFYLVNYLQERTGEENLCLAGGVMLNSVAGGKIHRRTKFKNIFIQPVSYDAGNALGSAFYAYNCFLGHPRSFVLDHPYWGVGFDSIAIEKTLHQMKLKYTILNNTARQAAELIAQGKIVGWFQGRMEAGARALGNRSILADPRVAEMKDILNREVKHREPFRPFAPSILEEKVGEYFEDRIPVSYMERVYPIKAEKQKLIPAVTHVDGTGRLQTVNRKYNPKYWQLIKEFEKITGIPIVLNTSFNVQGEPIVCSPADAIRCFFTTGIDDLILDNFWLSKR